MTWWKTPNTCDNFVLSPHQSAKVETVQEPETVREPQEDEDVVQVDDEQEREATPKPQQDDASPVSPPPPAPWIEKQLTPMARALTQSRSLGCASIELAVRAFARVGAWHFVGLEDRRFQQLLVFWESLRLLPLEFPLTDLRKKFRARWRLTGWGGSREKRLKDLQEAFLLHWLGILRRQRVRCMSPGDLYVGLFVAAVILLTEEPRGKKCRQDKHLQILFALSQKCFEGVSLVQ
ncbi:hypothetical protein DFQ27_001264 [Actinomortierella ambigua]|uniref:Uncharacterized protein n=1 Tax=Actinomortierella ambigua TaxID=1343610 RepID=A0A9P6QCS4_9FUNG|nr:hypothetical protein DFQ27_001264 [Actinomortierella ambigua]